MMAGKQYKCQRVARITKNGYLNYLREFKKRCCGMSPQDMVRYGAKAWNKLSCREKEMYRNMADLTIKKKNARSKTRRPKKKLLSSFKRSACVSKENRSSAKVKRDPCVTKAKCSHPGPITANAYLNFLRVFRKQNCGLKPQELIKKGARQWCTMTIDQRMKFERQACRVTKSARHKARKICKLCN